MRRLAKFVKRTVIVIVAFVVAAVIFLEVGSQYYKCPDTQTVDPFAQVCNPGIYPVRPDKLQTIQTLVFARLQGVEPSRTDLDRAINITEYARMPGLNGVFCDGMIFVRDNLGGEGKYFVARHELEHIFRSNGIDAGCRQEEYCATMTAARGYPVGFIQTIGSSLFLSARESPTVWCFLFGSWRIFRLYVAAL